MTSTPIVCSMCGFSNAAGAERCVSCGAKLETFSGGGYSDEDQGERQYQQEGFEWKWVFASLSVYLVLQAIILAVLPVFLSQFDPQGLPGLGISVLVWFVGGIILGLVSPGKTFMEPAVGAFIAVIPTVAYLILITPEGFQPSTLAYVVGGLLGVMISMFGAFVGERMQPRGMSKGPA